MSKVMKKNLLLLFNCANYIELKHIFRIMKITSVLTFVAIIQLSATTLHSQSAKVNIGKNTLLLNEFINEIEKQTDYLFMYSEKEIDLQQQVHVNAKDKPVSKVLEDAFVNSEIKYNFNEGYISLRKAQNGSGNQVGKKLTGTVKDVNGEPIIGANIMVKGTSIGNITDIDGRFILDAPAKATLVISYIGYLPQEIAIGNKSEFSISLKEDTKTLDEVVVIGYGTTSTRKLASAVTSIKGEKLQDLPFNDITASLQGRASGVIVQQSGGQPGTTPSISIRGGGDPIYVIDGVVSSSWDFNMINPVDIESLSILKDAASLAVYGSRAGDGIVLVKTKQGKKGKTSITYFFNADFSQPTVLPDKVDAYTYASEQNNAAMNDGFPAFHIYDEATMGIIGNQSDPFRYANTDWLKLGLKNVAPEYKHSLSMNGSAKLVNYYLSLGVLDQGGLYSSNSLNYNRYTLRSNVNTTFDKIGLTIGLNVNGALEKKQYPSFGSGSIWGHLIGKTPLTPAFNADGTYSSATDHPLVEMDERSGYDRSDDKYINTQLVADWNLPWVQGVTLGTMVNYRLNDSHKKTFNTKAPQYYPDGALYPIALPSLKEQAYFGDAYNFEVSAAYLNTFNEKHTIDAKFVYTVSESNGSNFWGSRKDYLSSAVDQLFAGSSVGALNSGTAEEGGRMGLVGRLKYDFDNRYILEGSFRYDGSDNFMDGYRWGLFPSVAAAWAITEEPFFKSLNLKFIDLIKARASYGETGTDFRLNKDGDKMRFDYLSVYNLNENAITIGGKLQPGFSEGDLVSPTLVSWFTRSSLNYGLDFNLFNNRIKGAFDYFYYVTKGGLMSPGDRYTTPLGKPLPQIKSNSEQRREGVELSLGWDDTVGNEFSYHVGFNMTYFNNLWKVKADEGINDLMNPWKRVTHQTDYYKVGYRDNGFYQTPEQVIDNPRRPQSSETKLGDLAYQDMNGDGKIDGEDEVRIGMPTMPHFTYGVDFGFNYKGFSLSGLIYGTGKRYIELGTMYKKGEGAHLLFKEQLDYWREDNRDAQFPRLSGTSQINGANNQSASSFWMKNASFIRLKNLQVGYDFRYKVLKNVDWINMCRVSLAGSNLLTFSGVKKFADPESAAFDGSSGYPVQRVYSIGLTVGF